MRDIPEIVIVGAGIGGCIAAIALAPYYRVMLIDKYAAPQAKVGECLAPAASRILHKLGLSSLLEQGHLQSHGILSYWGSNEPSIADNLPNPDGLGWHLDRQLFETQLREAAKQRGVKCVWPAQLIDAAKTTSGWTVQIQTAEAYMCINPMLLIDATGRQSALARVLGAERHSDDRLISLWLTALVTVQKQLSVLSHTERGWWYSAPLPTLPDVAMTGAAANVPYLNLGPSIAKPRLFAWQVMAPEFDKTVAHCPQAFLEAASLVPGFSTLVDQVVPGSATLHGIVAANSARLEQVAGAGWFAIGDAALCFDPLSSQGMFNAMATAMQLADLLIEYGLSDPQTTPAYQQQLDNIWRHYLRHRQFYYGLAVQA
ncbi:NAD(P)/FAD-dependent oxidoreductase [Pseudoalteromonas fenneropenaei]|uniref:NAD(P)/FAD-dependent oxidoreductase n=1 Tax=Pseudoalteromonas fenneropenaei TaxID=1737459 RepID=A0ABV7CNB0_9GAMM